MTPIDLEVLIHCHVSPERHPRADTSAVRESLATLYRQGLIHRSSLDCSEIGIFETTTRGAAHIKQLCNLQLPRAMWIDGAGRVIKL